MAQAIISPKASVLPARLDAATDLGGPDIEIDRVIVTDADLAAETISVDASKIEQCSVTGAVFNRFDWTDTVCIRLEAAGMQAYKSNLLRVSVRDSRLTGAEFAEARFEDCVFKNVKFDEAGFRFATFTRVRFEDCMLRSADFSSARLHHVTFVGCDLEAADFTSAQCKEVDVRGEDLTTAKGLLGLKGATISAEQLIQLAPLLAAELGFKLES